MKRGKRADDGWARTSCLVTGAAAGEVFVSMFFDQRTPRQTERQWTSFNREGNIAPGTVFPLVRSAWVAEGEPAVPIVEQHHIAPQKVASYISVGVRR